MFIVLVYANVIYICIYIYIAGFPRQSDSNSESPAEIRTNPDALNSAALSQSPTARALTRGGSDDGMDNSRSSSSSSSDDSKSMITLDIDLGNGKKGAVRVTYDADPLVRNVYLLLV